MKIQNSQLSEKITEFEKDSRWFYENADLLRKRKLSGKFVAVNNKEVIASGESFDIVVEKVECKGKNPAYVVIEYVYLEETIVLF